jgi:hypothetical protein
MYARFPACPSLQRSASGNGGKGAARRTMRIAASSSTAWPEIRGLRCPRAGRRCARSPACAGCRRCRSAATPRGSTGCRRPRRAGAIRRGRRHPPRRAPTRPRRAARAVAGAELLVGRRLASSPPGAGERASSRSAWRAGLEPVLVHTLARLHLPVPMLVRPMALRRPSRPRDSAGAGPRRGAAQGAAAPAEVAQGLVAAAELVGGGDVARLLRALPARGLRERDLDLARPLLGAVASKVMPKISSACRAAGDEHRQHQAIIAGCAARPFTPAYLRPRRVSMASIRRRRCPCRRPRRSRGCRSGW